MTRKTLETTLFLLAQKRAELYRAVEFNRKSITPPWPVAHLYSQIADIEAAITEIELINNVRVVDAEEVKTT